MADLRERLQSFLVPDDDCGELSPRACHAVPRNAAKLVAALTLQKLGDRIADPKTVLAWMLSSLGAPCFAVALLVPVRESGSLLPQAALVGVLRRFGVRSRVWAVGALGQSLAVAGIGFIAATLSGLAAGTSVLLALAVFSLARAVGSITAKDVIGKTIPKGSRGKVSGVAASVAGFGAVGTGLALTIFASDASAEALALLIAGASLLWLGAVGVFLTVDEEPSTHEGDDEGLSMAGSFALLREDQPFRRFVIARTLLLVTALSPPLVVSLSASIDEGAVAGVGPFVAAAGVASLVSSPIWGHLSDRSSRLVMAVAAAGGGILVLAFLGLRLTGLGSTPWLGPATYLLLAIIHAGARLGRKTYVIDLGHGEERTRYVAVSNTLIGGMLLVTGLLGALVTLIGTGWALATLAVGGLIGSVVAFGLPEMEN